MNTTNLKLADIADIYPGYPFRGPIEAEEGGEHWVLQLKDVELGRPIDWNSCVQTELPGKKQPLHLEAGDLVFAARGTRNHAFAVGFKGHSGPFVAAPHFFHLRIKDPESVYDEFLAFLLNYGSCRKYFMQAAEGSAAKSIKRSTLENAPICLPTVERQLALLQIAQATYQERETAEQLIANGEWRLHALATNEMVRARP